MGARTDDFERSDAGTTSPIEVTWASTSADPARRLRIAKIWAPEGKWPVTDGVKRQAYVFEHVLYPDLEAFSDDLGARVLAGVSAIVAGRLKLLSKTIDRNEPYPRNAKNIADLQSWLLVLDFDGLTSMKAGGRRSPCRFRPR
jgi:hypothetical protein